MAAPFETPDSAATGRPAGASLAARALLLAVAAYLLWPALHSVHPEGFSAQVQIAAAAANDGLLDRANLTYPLHAEYFYLTRAGVVMLLQALMALMGTTGDIVFRVLMLASFAVLVAASLSTARRLAGVGLWWAAAALLLAPGLAELAFYFHDNLPAAAFGVIGLALLSPLRVAAVAAHRSARWPDAAPTLGAGAALAFGVVCRIDTLLLLPWAGAIVWWRTPGLATFAARSVVFAIGFGAALLATQAYTGASLLQSIDIGRFFNAHQAAMRSFANGLRINLYLLGFALYGLLPFGAYLQWRRDPAVKARLALVVVPLLLLAVASVLANETRQFYPLLAPVVALWGGRALQALAAPLAAPVVGSTQRPQAGRRRVAAVGVALAIAVLWLAPPKLPLHSKDGPRLPFGRLWSIAVWREWQAAVERDRLDVQRLVDRLETQPRMAIALTHFNTDHYLRLALWQRDFRPFTTVERLPQCDGGLEIWSSASKPAHELLLIRTENPHFLQQPTDYIEALQLQRGLRCLASLGPMPVVVSGLFPEEWRSLVRLFSGLRPELAQRRDDEPPQLASNALAPNRSADLSPEQVDRLRANTDRSIADQQAAAAVPLPDLETLVARFGPKVAWVRYRHGRPEWTSRAPATEPLPR